VFSVVKSEFSAKGREFFADGGGVFALLRKKLLCAGNWNREREVRCNIG
jgi:hypothetical protein